VLAGRLHQKASSIARGGSLLDMDGWMLKLIKDMTNVNLTL